MSDLANARDAAQKGETARKMMSEALVHYSAACALGEWDDSETIRTRAHDALDSYFDAQAALHRMSK